MCPWAPHLAEVCRLVVEHLLQVGVVQFHRVCKVPFEAWVHQQARWLQVNRKPLLFNCYFMYFPIFNNFHFFQACAGVCVALRRCEVLLQWLGVVSEAEVGRTSSNCCVGNFKITNFFYFCIFIVLRCDVNFSVDPLQRIMSLHFIRYFTLVYTFCTFVMYRISTDFAHGYFLSCPQV